MRDDWGMYFCTPTSDPFEGLAKGLLAAYGLAGPVKTVETIEETEPAAKPFVVAVAVKESVIPVAA